MSSDSLMMDYEGGDLLLAGAAVAGCRVTAQACVCRLCADLKTAWRLNFSDASTLGVCIHDDALYKSTSYLTF